MKNWVLYLVLFVVGILLGYQLTLKFYPNLLYRGAKKKINIPVNTVRYPDLPDANLRSVVKPNPDFLYATAFYDLSDGPVEITGELPDSSYWSLAFYEPNTVNYYIKNDTQFPKKKLKIILAKEGQEVPPNKEDFELITTDKSSGMMLWRILVTNDESDNVAKFKANQESIQLKPFNVE